MGDKVPAVDHVLHAIGTVVAPVSGAILFLGPTGVETDLPGVAALATGAGIAEAVHLGRAALRPASTTTTAGVGNPVLSLLEDAGSALLTAMAFLLPILGFVLVLLLFTAVGIWLLRRRGRRPAKS